MKGHQPFTLSKGWLHRFKNWFRLKKIKKNARKAAPVDEEAATRFPTELKLIKEKVYHKS